MKKEIVARLMSTDDPEEFVKFYELIVDDVVVDRSTSKRVIMESSKHFGGCTDVHID